MSKAEQGGSSADEQSVILTDDIGPVRILTFNRAEAHNAVSAELMTAIGTALASAAQDMAVGSVVLTDRTDAQSSRQLTKATGGHGLLLRGQQALAR